MLLMNTKVSELLLKYSPSIENRQSPFDSHTESEVNAPSVFVS